MTATRVKSAAESAAGEAGVLVIDTSYGSTVGVLGHEPVVDPDSRGHVERLQLHIAEALHRAGIGAGELRRIVVGVGPAPFTGLRVGIVTARALGYATGARVVGQDVLTPQALWLARRRPPRGGEGRSPRHMVLAVNDARRRQLYYALYEDARDARESPRTVVGMDIAYPHDIVVTVNAKLASLQRADLGGPGFALDVTGHGAGRYPDVWPELHALDRIIDSSVLDRGAPGLRVFAERALRADRNGHPQPAVPLYLRRPDISIPRPHREVHAQ